MKVGDIVQGINTVGTYPNASTMAFVITALWPDSTSNTDPNVAPVLADVVALPLGCAPLPIGVMYVYGVRSNGGYQPLDYRAYGWLVDDVVSTSISHTPKPVQKAAK